MYVTIGRNKRQVQIQKGAPLVIVAPFGKSDYTDDTDYLSFALELEKGGADIIQELTTVFPFNQDRKRLINSLSIPYGTVLAYEFIDRCNSDSNLTPSKINTHLKEILEEQIEAGVDYLTVHASLSIDMMKNHRSSLAKRAIPIPSRAGSMLIQLMNKHKIENPFYSNFKYICSVCFKNDITLSLGSTFRAGAIIDAMDAVHIAEIRAQSNLVIEAKKIGFDKILLEGFGHGLPQDFERYCNLIKTEIPDTPITALGPLSVDTAVGLDNVAAAIGIAFGRQCGLALVNVITSKEHISMPTLEDIKMGIMCARLGGYIGDVIMNGKESINDSKLSIARHNLNWDQQEKFVLFPELFRKLCDANKLKNGKPCEICSRNCPHLIDKYM